MRPMLFQKSWNLFYSNVVEHPVKLACFNVKRKTNTREVKLHENEERTSTVHVPTLRYINAFIHHKMELGIAEIHHCYTQYAKVTLYRQMKLYIELEVGNSYHKNSVQQRKASVSDFRLIIGTLKSLGKTADTFLQQIPRRVPTWMPLSQRKLSHWSFVNMAMGATSAMKRLSSRLMTYFKILFGYYRLNNWSNAETYKYYLSSTIGRWTIFWKSLGKWKCLIFG